MRTPLHALTALALVAGCTQDRTLSEITVTRLGVRGGEALSPDGLLRLAVPEGALTADTDISIAIDRTILDGANASPIYQLGPTDVAFARDVELRVEVRASPGTDELDLADLASGAALLDAVYDESASTLTTSVRQPSRFAARRRPNRCANHACGDDCTTGSIARACSAAGRCVPTFVPLGCGMGPDAGAPEIDAGTIDIDAGAPETDAGTPETDAGAPETDAGEAPLDAGTPEGDGGTSGLQELEPNDTIADANWLPVGLAVEGRLEPAGDVDVFAVDVPSDGVLTAFTFTSGAAQPPCSGVDTAIELQDGLGAVLASNDDSPPGFCSRVSLSVSGPGRYYVAVRHFASSAATNPYSLQVDFAPSGVVGDGGSGGSVDGGIIGGNDATVPPPVDAGTIGGNDASVPPPVDAGTIGGNDASVPPPVDAGSSGGNDGGAATSGVETEPNDTAATANAMPANSAMMATFGAAADVDHFIVDVLQPSTLTAYTYTQAGNPQVCVGMDTVLVLSTAAGGQLAQNDDQMGNFCSRVSMQVGPGQYVLQVRNFTRQPSATPYYLDVLVQ